MLDMLVPVMAYGRLESSPFSSGAPSLPVLFGILFRELLARNDIIDEVFHFASVMYTIFF